MESDDYDVISGRKGANDRTLCGAIEGVERAIPEWDWGTFFPGGTVQAKVADARMAEKMQMVAALGRPCTGDFLAAPYLDAHPEYGWMRGLLTDLKTQPWTLFSSGMTRATTPLLPGAPGPGR